MKRLLLLAGIVLACASPALAQKVDWSKPQIMDAPPGGKAPTVLPEDKALPIEVYTTQDLAASGSPSVKAFVRSLDAREPSPTPEKPVEALRAQPSGQR